MSLKAKTNNLSLMLSKLNANDCVICLEKKQKYILIPCKHKSLCEDCKVKIEKSTNKCPICRSSVDYYLNEYEIKHA
jgi:hypothetical protein